jgi:hypothetical protein
MRFNTAQLQELSGARREQLRHWKKVLRPLIGRDGRCEQYTFPEVLAVAVVSALVDELGISVSKLRPCADELFALMHEFDDLSSLPEAIHVTAAGELRHGSPPEDCSFATVRLSEVLAKLRGRLAPAQRRQLLLPLAVQG